MPAAETQAKALLEKVYEDRDSDFGNGRTVRNFFEDCLTRHAERLAGLEDYSKKDLVILHESDIPPIEEMKEL